MQLTICKQIDEQLDELEARLPSLAANVVSVNRALTKRTTREMARFTERTADTIGAIADAAYVGMRTVTGTARWGAEETVSTATTAVRQTVGQAKAQTTRTVDAAADELEELADEIDPASAPVPAANDLEAMTKSELYDRAQDMDIDGRSSMSKAELITAIRAER